MKIICKGHAATLALLIASLTWSAQAVDPTGLIPFGWELLAEATGDLNKDGIDDLALAIAPADEVLGSTARPPERP